MFELLSITLKESIILFDIKYYGQVDGEGGGDYGFPPLSNISKYFYVSPRNYLTEKLSQENQTVIL